MVSSWPCRHPLGPKTNIRLGPVFGQVKIALNSAIAIELGWLRRNLLEPLTVAVPIAGTTKGWRGKTKCLIELPEPPSEIVVASHVAFELLTPLVVR